MAVLSGGTGTPKLLRGLKELADFAVIVNTAEDIWISGNRVSPDIDSVLYTLAGIIDDEKWWGIKGDTFRTHEMLLKLGWDEFMAIGDLDRAVHIFRSELLRKGLTLTEATRELRKALGVEQEVLPMCDEDVETRIVTDEGDMHFQEFWVKRKGKPEVIDVYFRGIERARATKDVLRVLKSCDFVLIGPSNPITSIMPIFSIRGVKNFLIDKTVIAVSPIVGNEAVSGPAGKFMRAKGYEVSPLGVADVYKDFLDILVVDDADRHLIGKYDEIKVVATNTIMKTAEDSKRLAEFILNLV
ncbi:2-phospho-L-lactate transferase [Archaeoglobus profundus]|uniref:2-phospho-L-lactate transferase n=1 Tax=Archaeoglobus profundus TaxID=84156 RepID=UPI00064E3707